MQTDRKASSIRDHLAMAHVVGIFGFAAYQLGKLGCEWVAEGIHHCKCKKNRKK